MTKDEALKLALEALDTVMWHGGGSCWIVDADKIEIAITAIDRALSQPDAFEQGRQEGMKQERALWELSKLGQEIEACQYAVDVAMPEYRCVGKCQYATPPQRPWVGLTAGEIHDTEGYKETREMYRFARDLEAKLKEKNT